jgi:uncharacterized delta-60 repeat protein
MEASQRVWMEALERRILLDATVATLGLDGNFGRGGFADLPSFEGGPTAVDSLVAAPPGQFYAVITDPPASDTQLIRFNADGGMDLGFGTRGSVSLQEPGALISWSQVLPQPDGKVIVGMGTFTMDPASQLIVGAELAVLRFNRDGTPDPTFGTDGQFTTPVDIEGAPCFYLQPDGKIVALCGTWNEPDALFMLRLNADGTPDQSFSPTGIALRPILPQGSPFSVLYVQAQVLADGQAVAYAACWAVTTNQMGEVLSMKKEFIPLRFTSDTDLTPATPIVCPRDPAVLAFAVEQPDGQLLIADEGVEGGTLTRFRLDGTQDPQFGVNGTVPLAFGTALVVQQDGKILLQTNNGGLGFYDQPPALQRLNADGLPDPTFAGGKFAFAPAFQNIFNCLVLPDDSIIVAGDIFTSDGSSDVRVLARVPPDGGVLDTFDPSSGTAELGDALRSGAVLLGAIADQSASLDEALAYRGLFADAPGWTLFNPDGTRKPYDDASE